jgi:hypothetical protein
MLVNLNPPPLYAEEAEMDAQIAFQAFTPAEKGETRNSQGTCQGYYRDRYPPTASCLAPRGVGRMF